MYGNCFFNIPHFTSIHIGLVLSSLQVGIQRYITNHSKLKGKVVSVHAVRTYGAMEVQHHPFLISAPVEVHPAAALSLRKPPPAPTKEEAGWTPESVQTLWGRVKSLPLSRIKLQTLGCPVHRLVITQITQNV
jgi:hypothetical protein